MIERTEQEQLRLHEKYRAAGLWKGPNIPEIAILSAESADLSFSQNLDVTRDLQILLTLHNIPYRKVVGVYGGRPEDSFVVILPSEVIERQVRVDWLKLIAFGRYDQESILISDRYRQSYLHFADGRIEYIGALQHCTQEEAGDDDFTYDPASGDFFRCVP